MYNHELDNILGMSLEERKKLQQQAIDEIKNDPNYFKELEEIENLSSIEIAFLYYINKKKTNLSGLAGYWLHSPINISEVIQKFLKSGLIKCSDVEYDLNKSTISELEEYAEKHEVIVKGNKEQIITTILNNVDYIKLEKVFGGKYYLRTEKGDNIINSNEDIVFFHHYGGKFGISFSDVDLFKEKYPELSAKDVAIGVFKEKLILCPYDMNRNYHLGLSEVYRYFEDAENQLKSLIIVCYFDYKFSIEREWDNIFVQKFIDDISKIISKLSLSPQDLEKYFHACSVEVASNDNLFIQFKKEILSYLERCKEDDRIKIDDVTEYLSQYYSNGRKSNISPYFLNEIVTKIIDDLNRGCDDNTAKKEQVVTYIFNDILNDKKISKYQLSLTCKKLGDYYYSVERFKESNKLYDIGLQFNSKLPVKKKIKEIKKYCV